ncbi:DUF3891 family protein [Halalkalibacter urbisdiaboli]|uniref:DUF3891 family protein n=1 Tax=Halalkalibacter urbisdiaboli TaxID=1960589 RepID=UPI000B44B731|nr:DUF3891 family protein [Halalkalibacter urbisdiaboli]
MIILETGDYFKMTTQHDHSIFSGELAKHLEDNLFIDAEYKDAVILAIREHDRAWIRLDQMPIWNDQRNIPFSFMDYPLFPKISMYSKGIDEVEEMNQYSALLCSIHYTSFGHIRKSKHKDCVDYMKNEFTRQKKLKSNLHNPNEEMIKKHFKLLQLFDELSLYVCLNEEGTSKSHEHPWYVEGFETLIDGQRYYAEWKSRAEIKIEPFPFTDEFDITFKTKYISKDLREKIGINSAYIDTSYTLNNFKIVR